MFLTEVYFIEYFSRWLAIWIYAMIGDLYPYLRILVYFSIETIILIIALKNKPVFNCHINIWKFFFLDFLLSLLCASVNNC